MPVDNAFIFNYIMLPMILVMWTVFIFILGFNSAINKIRKEKVINGKKGTYTFTPKTEEINKNE